MPHIHVNPGEHDATASAFIVRTDLGEPAIMLHKHKKLATLLQFGGHIEITENPLQAIAHELLEESGYNLDQLFLLQPKQRIAQLSGVVLHPMPVCSFTHKFPGLDHYHTDTTYAFVAHEPPKHNIGAGESEDVRTFTASQLEALSASEIMPNIKQIALHVLSEFYIDWEQVPATSWQL
jgi:8-oxo-dGTP pyrophosphatase MutT (NUDIX family)